MISTLDLHISPGKPFPFGVSHPANGLNFAIAAKNAQKMSLCLFDDHQLDHPAKEIPLNPSLNRTGDVWHIQIQGLPPSTTYAYRIFSQSFPEKSLLLLDPYAKEVASPSSWHSISSTPYRPLGKSVPPSNFDWQGDKPLKIPSKDLVIYEMHVRGFTQDQSSQVQYPGTFAGVVEKIPYLKQLGVNAVELLPIHEFNENEVPFINPKTKQKLVNYFGYSTVNFFSPMNRYASGQVIDEFKVMVRELHKNGIEVILDVVFNHTAEGDSKGSTFSFRGLNASAYYMIDPKGIYLNFSGCGNTVNSNHPWTRQLILESLRYWVTDMHIDGFRFDLASILTRSENGAPLAHAPIVDAISQDPILSQTKLIAEAWDAGGLYQVGGFYPGIRWSEWNGKYRDVIRRFIKGTPGNKTAFATALCGSQDIFGWRGSPQCSINFVTAHDGFSLADLVSYNKKHNEENGENNRDGFDHNESWNCGVEGPTKDKKIVHLREQQMRNFHLALMISQGIPMIVMGDEYAHTREGNNNTWCQDNQLNWFLWDQLKNTSGFHRFFQSLIHFRNAHPLLRNEEFLTDKDITWHGLFPCHPDWNNENHFVAFTLNDRGKPSLYTAFNASNAPQLLTFPSAEAGKHWMWVVNTSNSSPQDFFDEECRQKVLTSQYRIPAYSAILLEAVGG